MASNSEPSRWSWRDSNPRPAQDRAKAHLRARLGSGCVRCASSRAPAYPIDETKTVENANIRVQNVHTSISKILFLLNYLSSPSWARRTAYAIAIDALFEQSQRVRSRRRLRLLRYRTTFFAAFRQGSAHVNGDVREAGFRILARAGERQPHVRASPITIQGGGDTRNAVALAPREECARRLGASHSKRMAAS